MPENLHGVVDPPGTGIHSTCPMTKRSPQANLKRRQRKASLPQRNKKMKSTVADLMASTARVMTAKFDEASHVRHAGDRGENLETLLMEFLEKHLPTRFGLTKGEVVTKEGKRSHAIDIIIYDKLTCPILYGAGVSGTSILPIEGVYGIIEVKSTLSKAEFEEAAQKIQTFKELAPRDLGVIRTREYVTVRRASRPFGIIFGYQLGGNSIESLSGNLGDFHRQIRWGNYFVNLVAVLGKGNVYMEGMRWDRGERFHLIDTDQTVSFFENMQFDEKSGKKVEEIYGVRVASDVGIDAFGRFFAYLQILLSQMTLNTPDVGQYLGAPMPTLIVRES